MIGWVDDGIGSMTTAASNLGAVKQRTNMQKEFVGRSWMRSAAVSARLSMPT
jgi:hypothetical protein